jgi:hypothetical protein
MQEDEVVTHFATVLTRRSLRCIAMTGRKTKLGKKQSEDIDKALLSRQTKNSLPLNRRRSSVELTRNSTVAQISLIPCT